ncbi:NAD-dependent epimerase/dehydratase family protein [Tardiphaga sp. 866_E4_N2_1]|uniref:NAD-dependent epimerase/dehydratase family protein n=1 Tax=unclassified Tardiphaga TaxID=2631404 RepID=UPI003F1F9A4F
MRILITGASGFTGPAIVHELLGRGHTVVLALRQPHKAARYGAGLSVVTIGDLAGPIDWQPHLEGIDAVIHGAALAHAGTHTTTQHLFAVNADGTDRLVRHCRRAGVGQVIYISSVRALVGTCSETAVEEDYAPQPTNDYGRSKLAAELAVIASGVKGAILRPPLVYGAFVRGNLALLARAAASPLPLPLGGLQGKRSIVSDRNLGSAVAFLLDQPPSEMTTALVSDSEPVTLTELVMKLRAVDARTARLFAMPGLLKLLFAAAGRSSQWDSLSGRLELRPRRLAALGWTPVESSLDGLTRLMHSLRQA